ncbi:uncharacterized protein JN550_001008 [Neoarthrinium moseri]|uniref:uncharacterized protein n=1 Tax=Neoarthrinium moseri TaxID=1658444 RepID=UPI001FDB516F|nr:uncharacterized protein JN550_001008 [Neoarthrinium moseri]KAI1876936.1 hypothetical protein JN550_001008 [Neoarthrinium moseri]
MAEVEEPQYASLKERIAALNQQKNFSSSGDGPKKRPPPPPPPGRPKSEVQVPMVNGNGAAPALPRRTTATEPILEAPDIVPGRRAPPPLPGRTNTNSSLPSPALPTRRPSSQTLGTRRGSNASDVSHISAISNLSLQPISSHTSATSTETQSTRKLPPTLDQAKLPPLPPTKREREAQAAREAESATSIAPVRAIKSAPIVPQVKETQRPGLPPRLPSRPAKSPSIPQQNEGPSLPARRLPPPPSAGFTGPGSYTPPTPRRPEARPEAPPPVPLSSRPTTAQISAVTVRAASNSVITCLVCRDFSRPDTIASQFPNHSLPRSDPVGYLANVLCASFPSHTDKARAIFTWCHHNIAYNVEEFFGKCIKNRSVEETIFHGKAVCQGYAEVYQAIARRAGLECVVIGGHGKGYGHNPLQKGQAPPPRDPTGHAWNAVRIDNGEWKLLDACWGAGALMNGQYHQGFNASMFYMSNDMFGLKHFPSDSRHFYRSDGRIPTWDEYMIGPTNGEKAAWYGNGTKEGISEFTFMPAEKHLSVNSNQVIRFQFGKICEHWDGTKHGKGKNYLLVLCTKGRDGRKDENIPLEHDGFWWWLDINSVDLGAPGQQVKLGAITTWGDNKNPRGLTKQEYYQGLGKVGWSMEFYTIWELVP